MRILSPRTGLVGALCLAFLASACETPAPEPVPPPPVYVVPTVALNSGVTESAAVYLAYIQDVASISPTFADGGEIRNSMIRANTWEPTQLSRGLVAYSAIVALQSPEFVRGVRGLASSVEARDALIRQIIADPAYAAQLPGADAAAGLIAANVGGQGQSAYAAGAAVKQSAYDIQLQRWSTQHITDRDERLVSLQALGETNVPFNVDSVATLQQAALAGQGLGVTAAQASPPYTPAVVRALGLAALAALGQAGEDSRTYTESLLTEPTSQDCLRFNKLMVLQCLAASRPHYEEVFCLGQHIIMDMAQCVIDSAGTVAYATPSITTVPLAEIQTAQTPN